MKFGSLFSGIGGFDLGFERAGMACAWQCEINDAAASVLMRRFGKKIVMDVRDVRRDNVSAVDLVCGGFPCQDLSVAGKRAGLAGERSGLWFEFRRVLDELRPQWVVIENVPGLLSSNGGRDFATILRGLVELRYGVCWRVLDAQYFGVAQRRRRVFIVGSLGDGRAAQVLFESEGMFGHPPARGAAGEKVAGTIGGVSNGGGANGPGRDVDSTDTLVVSAPRAAHHSRDDLDHGAYVTAFDLAQITSAANRTTVALGGPVWPLNTSGQMHVAYGGANTSGEIDVATACNAHGGSSRLDFESETFVFEPRYARNGRGAPDTIAPPLKAENGQTGKGDGAPVVAFTHSGYSNQPAWITGERTDAIAGGQHPSSHQGIGIIQNGIRRLTPTECERLQGFPDGWTDLPQSDSARYRQLGNAVAVPVIEWIGKRIMALE